MPQEFTDSEGVRHILDGRKWRPVTEEEAQILDEGFARSTGRATGQGLRSLGGLAEVIASFSGGRASASPGFREGQQQLRQQGFDRISQAQEQLDIRGDLTPGASTAGAILTELIPELIPGGIIAGGVRAGLTRGSTAAAKKAAQEAAEATVRRGAGLGDTLAADATEAISGRQAEAIGEIAEAGGSVGAARAKQSSLFQMMKRTPGLKQVLEKVQDFMDTPRRLSNDQERMLASVDIEPNAVERVGFELLPGQAEGNGVVAEVMKSQPFMADAFEPVLSANAKSLETKVLRAMGLPEEGFGRSSLAEFDTLMRGRFQEVASNIDNVRIPDELRASLDDRVMMTADDARLFGLSDEGPVDMSGGDIMELRSQLNDSLAAARSDRSLGVRARHIEQQLDKVDDLIGENITGGKGGEAWNQWKDTQQRWRVGLAVNRPGVVDSAGDLSIKRLANSLDKGFERDFRKNLFQIDEAGELRNPEMPRDIAEMLDFTRVARAFESNLGDSGTATRQAIQKLLSGDLKGLAKQRAAARFITDVLLENTNIPQAAKGVGPRAVLPDIANVNRPAAAGPAP